jgi:hypothetical protein
MAIYTGQYRQAVDFARSGQEVAPAGSASAVRLSWQEARGHARMGDAASFEQAVGRATEAFDRLPEQPEGGIFSFTAADFPYYGASCYVWVGQARHATEQAREAIALFDAAPADWPAARVIARTDLAMALLQLQQVEDACVVGGEALDTYATGRRSHNVVRRAAELRSALQAHRDLPVVRELDEHFHAVCGDPP